MRLRNVLFLLQFILAFTIISAQNKVELAKYASDSEFKDLVESMLPPMIEWRGEELLKFKTGTSPIQYATGALYYADNYHDRLFTKETKVTLHIDSILYASMFYIAEHNLWDNECVPLILCQYAERLYENGYNKMAAFWANLGVIQCLNKNCGGPVYGEFRSLESLLEVDSIPDSSVRTQLAMLEGFKELYKNDPSEENHRLLTKHYTRAAEIALLANHYSRSDSIKEEALDFLWDRTNPDILSGKTSIIRGTSPDMFQLRAIESELNINKGDTIQAIEDNESLLWRYYENAIVGNLKAEHFPYYFKSIIFLAKHNRFNEENFEHLLYASNYIREYLGLISSDLSPIMRERFYQEARDAIKYINSQLFKFIGKEEVNTTIYNNIVLFKGLDLTTQKALNSHNESIRAVETTQHDYNLLLMLVDLQYQTTTKQAQSLKASNFRQWIETGYDEIRDKLDNNEVAIEFYNDPISKYYYAAICAKGWDEPVIVSIMADDQMHKSFTLNRGYFTSKNGAKIWHQILSAIPIESYKIYFSPDGLLYGIAIEYLPIDTIGETQNINDVYEMHRLSSTKEISNDSSVKMNIDKNVLLVGNINYGQENSPAIDRGIFDDFSSDSKISPLVASKVEIEELFSLFTNNGWNAQILTGNDVTRDVILNSDINYSIEHISTHGFYIREQLLDSHKSTELTFLNRPLTELKDKSLLRSGFVISAANDLYKLGNDDGIITAADIAQTDKNNVDLVVISACQSGQGDISSDGIHGLLRGYKIAGVKSIIATLWDIDDWVSELLMTEFYANYLKGFSKVESLKKAQKAVMTYTGTMPDNKPRNLELPKYWASFILVDCLN